MVDAYLRSDATYGLSGGYHYPTRGMSKIIPESPNFKVRFALNVIKGGGPKSQFYLMDMGSCWKTMDNLVMVIISLYCSPGNGKYLEFPYTLCDPYSNPQPQEIMQILPNPVWEFGYPTTPGEGWIGDPRTWELDVGRLSQSLYFYQDPGTTPVRRKWMSIDLGTEIFKDPDQVAEWTVSDFDILVPKAANEPGDRDGRLVQLRVVCWTPPQSGMYKLNADAVIDGVEAAVGIGLIPESPNFKVRFALNVIKGGGPKSQFYLMDMGSCWKNNGQPCNGDVTSDVTRYNEMIINPNISSWCHPDHLGVCPPYHTFSNGTRVHRNDTARFPYAAYHFYCSPGNGKYLEFPYTLCDPYSNPQPQEIMQILPNPVWGEFGYPTTPGEGWIGDPRTWELDVGRLSQSLYFYQDPGTTPVRRKWMSIDLGTEIFKDPDQVAEWTVSDFDILVPKAANEPGDRDGRLVQLRVVCWTPPQSGMYKLNADAVIDGVEAAVGIGLIPESPNFKVRFALNVIKGGGPKSQFYLMDMGSCWKNNGQPCNGDVTSDVTRYNEMIINPNISSWCHPDHLGVCPPYHTFSNGTRVHRNDTARFPYAAYHFYCSPGNGKYLEFPYTLCDPYSNPQPQEIMQILPNPVWGEFGYPTTPGEGWIGDPRTWELDVGRLSQSLYFYQDPGTTPVRRKWMSIDLGTEIFKDPDQVAEWTVSDFDILVPK
ncbi:hypothetical protein LWI29_035051 [Acer saccharum]|uniref:DUF7705 domain-containing protein n=1 Tax=Acer saccharum TaxID=4024 RepID=A0AA39VH11_ACESA|nr:hypothetical protein LWI29_035051 [Acer saccharum]